MEHIDTIIIGAGVVGMATARQIALRGGEVLVLEAEESIGTITTARNSGVIHAGIYYPPGSLKAKLCVEGRDLLYAFAAEHGVPVKRCGKLIVATEADHVAGLSRLMENARASGVTDLKLLTAEQARAMEPQLRCVGAIHSPSTGLIDVHAYMLALQGEAEEAGAILAIHAPLLSAKPSDRGFVLQVGGATPMEISCRNLINAAGLGAQQVAASITGFDITKIPPLVLAKGNYFSLGGPPPFQMLIYPLPTPGGSGLHATCDFGGRMRFGPDVEWIDHADYRVDPDRRPQFEESIRRYWSALPSYALEPDYSGIRPKLGHLGPHNSDFVIQTKADHGVPGLINLFGIESPGLTASLALAKRVAENLL